MSKQPRRLVAKSLLNAIQVKAFKQWPTPDGVGYSCNLYYQGKRCATVNEDGNGGPIRIHWESDQAKRLFDEAVKNTESHFSEETISEMSERSHTFLVGERLMGEIVLVHELRRLCEKHAVIRLPDDSIHSFKNPIGPAMRAAIKLRYPTAVVVNDEIA